MRADQETGFGAAALARQIADRLRHAGIDSPHNDARWLIEGVTGIDPHRSPLRDIPRRRMGALEEAVARRAAREPLQLVLGGTNFRGLTLVCKAGVFIPRPETEVVAQVAIDASRSSAAHPRRLVDVGTGTGAIACSLAAEVAHAHIVAVDIDPAAVALATENLGRVRAGEASAAGFASGTTATVREGDLLDPVDDAWHGQVDLLVSNPPYLPATDRGRWQPEVGEHDPDRALVGGTDGHELVDRLLELAATWLRPGGTVVIEIDDRRADDARHNAEGAGLDRVELVNDLTGRPRCVVARRRR